MTHTQLREIMEDYSGGDQEFILEFAGLCKNNYEEFIEGMYEGIEHKDSDRLSKVIHKIKPLNKLFQLSELQALLDESNTKRSRFFEDSEIMKDVQTHCNKMIAELQKIK